MSQFENIEFCEDVALSLSRYLSDNSYSSVGLICDRNTQIHCLPLIEAKLTDHQIFSIEPGEREKNLTTCHTIWQWMTRQHFDRSSLIINLGGGVIGDMGGFCAATFKRGIDFVQVPTTLLAQVDASIGGKLGVDFQGLKNHIGVFRQPGRVFIHTGFLQTLPDRQIKAGLAEVVKHALISDEAEFKRLAGTDWESLTSWDSIVSTSIGIKCGIVDQDPAEKGRRKLLNFGHTIGHAIESYCLDQGLDLLHGEAVAIGMICEAYVSRKMDLLPGDQFDTVVSFLQSTFTKKDLGDINQEDLGRRLAQDKKNKGKRVLASLLESIGKGRIEVEISGTSAWEAIQYYQSAK